MESHKEDIIDAAIQGLKEGYPRKLAEFKYSTEDIQKLCELKSDTKVLS